MISAYLVCALLAAVCIWAVASYMRLKAHYKSLRKFPGTPQKSLIGNISWMLSLYSKSKNQKDDPTVLVTRKMLAETALYQDSGMHCTWYGLQPVVYVYKAEIVEHVLGRHTSVHKAVMHKMLEKYIGTGLITSNDEKWIRRRKLIRPCFYYGILKDFMPVFNRQSLELVQILKFQSDKEYIDITPLTELFSLDVACETMMGVSPGFQKGKNSEYVQAFDCIQHIFKQRLASPWLHPDILFYLTNTGKRFKKAIDICHDFRNKVVKERREKILSGDNLSKENDGSEDESSAKGPKVLLDLLLDMNMNGQLSDEDVGEEVDTFIAGGHDTTAMAITYVLYCIGLDSEVQKKIVEELDEIFEGDIDRPVTYDDTKRMKYLECALKESQRLFPSAIGAGRKVEEDIHFDGFEIPRDTTVRIDLVALHRNPEVFPNPGVFDPERFTPENSAGRHPYAFIPFSQGRRNCIGLNFATLELKTAVCNILRHFQIVSLVPLEEFHVKQVFTLKPAQEVKMKFLPKH